MRSRLFIVGVIVASCVVAHGECRPIAPDIQSALNSPRWPVRRDAFERIAANTSSTLCPAERSALIHLQDTEDHASEFSLVDLFEDDAYVAYYGQLSVLVQKIATTTNNPQAWRALVYGRYNGDSPFGQWLAKHRAALPFIVELLKSRYSARRMAAVEVVSLRLFYGKSAKPGSDLYVSPEQYRHLKAQIRFLARTDIAPVSDAACMGLGLIGDNDDIPLLQRIATSSNRDKYAQEFARQAIKQIRGDKHTAFRLRTQNSFK